MSDKVQTSPWTATRKMKTEPLLTLSRYEATQFRCSRPSACNASGVRIAMLDRSARAGGYALGTGNSVPEYVPDANYFAMISAAIQAAVSG